MQQTGAFLISFLSCSLLLLVADDDDDDDDEFGHNYSSC